MSLFFFCFIFVLFVAKAIIKTPEENASSIISNTDKRLYPGSAQEEVDIFKSKNLELFNECEEMRERFNLHIQLMDSMDFYRLENKLADESWERLLELTGQTGQEGLYKRTGHEVVHSRFHAGSYHCEGSSLASSLGSEPHEWEYIRTCKRELKEWVKVNCDYVLPHDYLLLIPYGICLQGISLGSVGRCSKEEQEKEIRFYKEHDLECLISQVENY